MFYMACYDLDRFRRFVFETRFLELFEVDEARVEAMRSDDQELLDFAIQWLRFRLFRRAIHEAAARCRASEATANDSGCGANPVLVIGGGIAGLTAAVELAEAGCDVILVEKSASLGGRVARMHQYFPKLCPPACGLEIHFRRLRNRDAITVLTLAEVEEVTGTRATTKRRCESRRATSTDLHAVRRLRGGLPGRTPGRVQLRPDARPRRSICPTAWRFRRCYAIDRAACPDGCQACEDACAYGAIEPGRAGPRAKTFQVSRGGRRHRLEALRRCALAQPRLRQVPPTWSPT